MWRILAYARTDQGLSMSRPAVIKKVLQTEFQNYAFTKDMRDKLKYKCVSFEQKERENPAHFAEELNYHQREIEDVRDRYVSLPLAMSDLTSPFCWNE